MSAGALLLEGALVLTLDDAGTAGPLAVAVEGGAIAAVGDGAELRRRFASAERIDCAGRVLLPGLVNAHLHPDLHVLKGLVEELGLHDWAAATRFNAALARLGAPAARGLQRAAVRAALADCALGGATWVACYGVTDGAAETCAEALVELGLNGHTTVRDMAFAPAGFAVPHVYRLHAEEALTTAELETAAAAHDRGEWIVIHAAETEHRVRLAEERFGTTTIRLLERWRLLSPRVLLSHAVWTDEEERALIARRGAVVLCSPTSELKLADGLAPVQEYLDAGATLALGTDCAVCNNSNDLFLEMRQLGLVQKLRYGPHALPAEQILRMAARGGAAALAPGQRRGALAPGWAADLILVDAGNPRLQPLLHRAGASNLAANLVYAATGQDVTDVMVDGRWIVRDRRLLTADAAELWREVGAAAEAVYDHIDGRP